MCIRDRFTIISTVQKVSTQEEQYTLTKIINMLSAAGFASIGGRTVRSGDIGCSLRRDRVIIVASMQDVSSYMFRQVP